MTTDNPTENPAAGAKPASPKKKRKRPPPRSRQRQVLEFVSLLAGALALRAFVAEPYEIPTGSMLPTVQIGDRLVISKLAYGARIPFTELDQLRWGSPKRGDIVVLLNPKPGEPDLAKRVVALPGDKVEVRSGRLVLNDHELPEWPESGECVDADRNEHTQQWFPQSCTAYRQTLDGTTFVVHHVQGYTPEDYGPTVIPPDHVFLMGDNRDRSLDSRSFGPVPIGKLKGRAFGILWSTGPHGLRWSRFLSPIKAPEAELHAAAQ